MDKTKRKGEEIPPFLNSNVHVWKNKSGDLTIINLRNVDEILQPPAPPAAVAEMNAEAAPTSPIVEKADLLPKLGTAPEKSVPDKVTAPTAATAASSQKTSSIENKKTASKVSKAPVNAPGVSKQAPEKQGGPSEAKVNSPFPTGSSSSNTVPTSSSGGGVQQPPAIHNNNNNNNNTTPTAVASTIVPAFGSTSKQNKSEYASGGNSMARGADITSHHHTNGSSSAMGAAGNTGGGTNTFDITNNAKFELMPGTSIGGNVVSEHASSEGAMRSLALFHNPLWGDGAAISVGSSDSQKPKLPFSSFTVESGAKQANAAAGSSPSPSTMPGTSSSAPHPNLMTGGSASHGTSTPVAPAGAAAMPAPAGMQFAAAPFAATAMNFPMFQVPMPYIQQQAYPPGMMGYAPGGMPGYYIQMPQGAVPQMAIPHAFQGNTAATATTSSLPARTGTNVEASPFVPTPPRTI